MPIHCAAAATIATTQIFNLFTGGRHRIGGRMRVSFTDGSTKRLIIEHTFRSDLDIGQQLKGARARRYKTHERRVSIKKNILKKERLFISVT